MTSVQKSIESPVVEVANRQEERQTREKKKLSLSTAGFQQKDRSTRLQTGRTDGTSRAKKWKTILM